MTETKHIVWSNIDLDLDDWYDDLHEQYPALGEEWLRDMMNELNFEYFGDEQRNLDIDVGTPILVLGDLGLWDGRQMVCGKGMHIRSPVHRKPYRDQDRSGYRSDLLLPPLWWIHVRESLAFGR